MAKRVPEWRSDRGETLCAQGNTQIPGLRAPAERPVRRLPPQMPPPPPPPRVDVARVTSRRPRVRGSPGQGALGMAGNRDWSAGLGPGSRRSTGRLAFVQTLQAPPDPQACSRGHSPGPVPPTRAFIVVFGGLVHSSSNLPRFFS